MPKKDRECGTKRRHKTKEGACIAARKKNKQSMNVYLCRQCNHWHIGNTRDPARSANRIGALLVDFERKLQRRMTAE